MEIRMINKEYSEKEVKEAIKCDGETRVSSQLQVEIAVAKGELDKAELFIKKLKL